MSAALDPEAAALLADGLDRLIAARPAARRRVGDPAWRSPDPALWRAMAELGLAGLGVPEACGGFGGSLADVAAVMTRFGRALLLEPMLSTTVLASGVLAGLCGSDPPPELARAVQGQARLAFAHHEPGGGYARRPVATEMRETDGVRLHGSKSGVLDAPGCDALIVTARRVDGSLGAFLVDGADAAVTWDRYTQVDGRPAADLMLSGVIGRAIGSGDAMPIVDRVLDRAALATCAEAVGAMEAVLTLCRDYLKTRQAFGRTLSSFQVLQHRIVDMHVALEEARALLDATLASWGEDGSPEALAACKVTVHRAGRFIGEQGLHLHGGIGMTDEFIASHYYKRLMALEACLGNADHHATRFADLCRAAYPLAAA